MVFANEQETNYGTVWEANNSWVTSSSSAPTMVIDACHGIPTTQLRLQRLVVDSTHYSGTDTVLSRWIDVDSVANGLWNSTPQQERYYLRGAQASAADNTDRIVFTGWSTNTNVNVVFTQVAWSEIGEPFTPINVRAEKRADALLRGMLTKRQRHMWEKFRYIIVPSPNKPGVVYKVPARGMIREFKDGRPIHDLCIHLNERLPIGDEVATFKLLIEAEETELHRIANVHGLYPTVV